jgi:hypothetical protein
MRALNLSLGIIVPRTFCWLEQCSSDGGGSALDCIQDCNQTVVVALRSMASFRCVKSGTVSTASLHVQLPTVEGIDSRKPRSWIPEYLGQGGNSNLRVPEASQPESHQ